MLTGIQLYGTGTFRFEVTPTHKFWAHTSGHGQTHMPTHQLLGHKTLPVLVFLILKQYFNSGDKATLFLFYVLQDYFFKLRTVGRKKKGKKGVKCSI